MAADVRTNPATNVLTVGLTIKGLTLKFHGRERSIEPNVVHVPGEVAVFARFGVPEPDNFVVAAGKGQVSVGRERDGSD